jgi:hypothetical protein
MKITVYKNPKEYISREYDLTNCSVEELEKQLFEHCCQVGVNPTYAAITLHEQRGWGDYEHIMKGGQTIAHIKDVSREILVFCGREVAA